MDVFQGLKISHPHENIEKIPMKKAYPQSTPILALFDHFTDTVNDIEDPQARLEGVNRFVQVRGSLLALQ